MDKPVILDEGERQVDWTKSFHGLSSEAFSPDASEILLAPINADDIEVKPDGIIYLPEIKYRRILNRAFGPGGWGLAPRGETLVTPKAVTREYALVVLGRSVFCLLDLLRCIILTARRAGLSQLLVVSKITSPLTVSRLPPRAANLTQ
jgi:hypothetical protein